MEVFDWLAGHTRRYNAPPSQQFFRDRFPNWAGEGSSDSLEALIDTFLAHVKRRAFSAKIIELAKYEYDPSKWHQLDQLMLDAARDLSALVPEGTVGRFSAEMRQRIDRYEEERRNPQLSRSLHMGIPPFDDVTNGMRPGNLVTIAGYSGLGKSLMSQFFVMNALEQDATGLILSLEMTKEEIFERLDTMVTNFSYKLLGKRDLPDDAVALWRRIAAQFASAQTEIYVKDRLSGCTPDRVYAEINRYKPDIAVVDYVQLMRTQRRSDAQWQVLVEVTNALKEIALATDCVIVMVSQDGRSAAQDGSTDQNMGGSISVYQAADIYLGLHQSDEMYAQERMEVRLLKSRRGERKKTAYLSWMPSTMSIEYRDDSEPAAREFTKAAA